MFAGHMGVALAALAVRATGRGGRVAGIVGLVVVSHWALDFVTHRPDLPLWPGGPEAGLGLWHSIPATVLVEGALFLGATLLYAKAFPARDRLGALGLAAMATLVGLIWISGPFAPPPPSTAAIAGVGLALWVFPFWAWRIEAHRGRPPR